MQYENVLHILVKKVLKYILFFINESYFCPIFDNRLSYIENTNFLLAANFGSMDEIFVKV